MSKDKLVIEQVAMSPGDRLEFTQKNLPLADSDAVIRNSDGQSTRFSVDDQEYETFQMTMNDDEFIGVIKSGSHINFDAHFRTNEDMLTVYRSMERHPEIGSCMDHIKNEAIIFDSTPDSRPLSLTINTEEIADELGIPEASAKKLSITIQKNFNKTLRLLKFKRQGQDHFKRWYVDGIINFELVFDKVNPKKKGIQRIIKVSPFNIMKFKVKPRPNDKDIDPKKSSYFDKYKYYYLYDPSREKKLWNRAKTGEMYVDLLGEYMTGELDFTLDRPQIIPEELIVRVDSGITTKGGLSLSYLDMARKALNQLSLLEDAVVVYRISRAPERRKIFIDTAGVPENKKKMFINKIMRNYKQKNVYDVNTGEIISRKHIQAMTEDFIFPVDSKRGTSQTDVSILSGGQNLGKLEDVEHFQKKLYRAMKVPNSRLMDDNKTFDLGRTQSITRDELNFFKYIHQARTKFNQVILEILKRECIVTNVVKDAVQWEIIEDCISLRYVNDNYYNELKDQELWVERAGLYNQLQEMVGVDVSPTWLKKNVLKMSDSDIRVERERIIQDAKERLELEKKKYEFEKEIADMQGKIEMLRDITYQTQLAFPEVPPEEPTGDPNG